MSTIFKLIIEDDEGKTTVYPLVDGEVSIGRKDGNTIRLMERNVSRRHARLVRESQNIFVEDLDSYNGVRINGERISDKYRVREGDLIEIGDYHLALRRADETVHTPTEPTQSLPYAETQEMPTADAGWPAGTVPEFQLPRTMLEDAAEARGPTRDTVLDEPHPALDPNPSERPTDRPDSRRATVPQGAVTRDDGPGVGPDDGVDPEAPTPLPSRRAEALVRGATQADEEPPRSPEYVSDKPRLICVSTQYAGCAYPLDRPQQVIGRVDENEIVIEHRSVSRQHARIYFDGRSHQIYDLQSANGILVNGEEYDQTNLRSGDLIELGSVRFRFVPAGEPFVPTLEEAQEMRAAGIELPSPFGDDAAESPAHYDPSTAATVTDSPRSVLLSSQASPSVAVMKEQIPDDPPDAVHPTADEGADPLAVIDGGQALESAFADFPSDDRRATQVEVDAAASPRPPLARIVFNPDEGMAAAPTYRKTMLGLIAVLATVVGILLLLLMGRRDGAHDHKLEELYNQGNYGEVLTYFEAHEGEFADPMKAAKLLGRAETRLERPELDNPTGLRAPARREQAAIGASRREGSVDGAVEALAVAPAGARSGALASREARAAEEPLATPGLRPDRVPSSRRPTRLFRLGRDALISGELGKAERYLSECLRRAPDYAPCHRSLAVLYGQRQNQSKALDHYRRYIELAPDARDADQVRGMIRAFESGDRR